MKRAFVLALVACVGTSYADSIIQDFEAGTDGVLIHSSWLPDFSGTSVGVDGTDDNAIYSTEQKNGGAQSGKISWDWDGTAVGVCRIQPSAAFNNNAAANRTAEPYIGCAVYGAAQGDHMELFVSDSGYEVFTQEEPITWNGWKIVERNILTDPVVGWVTGNSALDATSCFFRGWFFQQQAANGTRVDYYIDDIAFTAAARGGSAVSNWSVY